MQTMKFITKNDKGHSVCWCTTNTLELFRDFMQYMLDSMNDPEDFMLWDTESDLIYNAYQIATKQYGMRKRTFEERLNNVQTGKWATVEI